MSGIKEIHFIDDKGDTTRILMIGKRTEGKSQIMNKILNDVKPRNTYDSFIFKHSIKPNNVNRNDKN